MKDNKFVKFIKRHRKGMCIAAVIVVLLLIFVLVFSRMKAVTPKKNEQLDKMKNRSQTTQIQKMDLSTSISVTGTIASADNRSVSASVAGVEVLEVKVEVGDYVNAGDTIVVLDSSDLEEELETAQDNYELAVTKSDKTISDAKENVTDAMDSYTDGVSYQEEMVAKAVTDYNEAVSEEASKKEVYDKAVKITKQAKKAYEKIKEEKKSLKKKLETAEQENREAQKIFTQAQEAYDAAQTVAKDENGNIDATVYQTYIDAKAAAEAAKASYEKAKADYDAVAQAKTAYSDAKKAEEEALKDYQNAAGASADKYNEYEKAVETQTDTNEKNAEQIEDSEYNYTITSKETQNNLSTQKKQVQNAEEKLGECVVTSPISGVITSVSVEAGDTYENGELFVVQDMTSFLVEATVDEYDISDIAKDMEAVVKTDATGDEELAGVVTYVAPTPESSQTSSQMGGNSSSSAEYKIQISLTDTNERLRVGMTAKTSIVLTSAKDVLAVPYDYVRTDKDGNNYIEVQQAQESKQITVTKGLESDYYVEIQSDEISEGMIVVAEESASSETKATESGEEEMNFPGGGFPGGGSDMPFGDGGNMPSGGGRGSGGDMPSGGPGRF